MGIGREVDSKVREYLVGDYKIEESRTIPEPRDIPFGNVAKKIRITALTIDLRDSTGLLEVHQKQTAGKIHKAFLYATARCVAYYGGHIRSFRGDGLLALWPAQDNGCSNAVRAAMLTKGFLSERLNMDFGKYRELDYGIGVDVGDAFIVRAGTATDANTNDLVFISPAVNFSVAVAEQAQGPNHIEICAEVYRALPEGDIVGAVGGAKQDMWTDGKVQWQGALHNTKCTSWFRNPSD